MLDLENITKTFNPGTVNEKKALSGLNLHLEEGDFVTVVGSNGAGTVSYTHLDVYKRQVLQFTRYCASALARRNIRVNSITPGPFPNISLDTDQEFIRRLSGKTMMNRTGKPEELNGALLLLCSEASSFMTGTNIIVDGGMTQW